MPSTIPEDGIGPIGTGTGQGNYRFRDVQTNGQSTPHKPGRQHKSRRAQESSSGRCFPALNPRLVQSAPMPLHGLHVWVTGTARGSRLMPGPSSLQNGAAPHKAPPASPSRIFDIQAVSREISRRFSLDDYDFNAAQDRVTRIDQIQLEEVGSLPRVQTRLRRTWDNLLSGLADTFTVIKLSTRLASYLGVGGEWMKKLFQLLTYTMLLMPGFAQMVLFYFLSHRVIRSVQYGEKPRNRLDMYVPRNHWRMQKGLRPVVIYVTGGAWIIGYKAWGSLLGRRLSKQGVIVCCLDYRNFPQGTIMDMLTDVNTGIGWVMEKIGQYGGDPDDIYLVGQSCGAQLATLTTLVQAEVEYSNKPLPGAKPRWSPSHIKGLVGVSGVYNCAGLANYFHERGLYHNLFDRIMSVDGKTQLKMLSPVYCVAEAQYAAKMPPVLLLHGTDDTCALVKNVMQFEEALRKAGVKVNLKLYKGQTHTSPLIENPMAGGTDELMDDILSMIRGQEVVTQQFGLCPRFLIKMASMVCPF